MSSTACADNHPIVGPKRTVVLNPAKSGLGKTDSMLFLNKNVLNDGKLGQ